MIVGTQESSRFSNVEIVYFNFSTTTFDFKSTQNSAENASPEDPTAQDSVVIVPVDVPDGLIDGAVLLTLEPIDGPGDLVDGSVLLSLHLIADTYQLVAEVVVSAAAAADDDGLPLLTSCKSYETLS